jgi:hypothetical protein
MQAEQQVTFGTTADTEPAPTSSWNDDATLCVESAFHLALRVILRLAQA